MRPLKTVIIGSGIAGLASAIRLAVNGFDVEVYEKNDCPGGKLGHFEKKGFQFDTGPSLFVQPQNIEELFEIAGENIADYFEYYPVQIACRYFYEDGTMIDAYADPVKLAKELADKIGEDETKVRCYLHRSEKLFTNVGAIFLDNSLHKPATFFKPGLRKALTVVRSKYLFKTMNEVNKASFNKNHTVQLFNRYATYNGSDPYQAPGMLCLIPHIEYNEGVFYPRGGMISITNALYNLALKRQVKFSFNSCVQQILINKRAAKGILVKDKEIPADIVVSNMDVYGTYKFLLNDEYKAHKILKQERSSSALVFYWGINKEFPQLQLHNIFFSNNYEEEFNCIFKKKTLCEDPTVYISITSKCEPGVQAPRGKENWFVLVNVSSGTKWHNADMIGICKRNIITKLNRLLHIDIAPLIEVEEVLDPVAIESKTFSFMGSIYGTCSNSKMAAFMRHPNFSKHINGLYFAGGTVHPGGGIPLCLKSAKIMSEIVVEDMEKILRRRKT